MKKPKRMPLAKLEVTSFSTRIDPRRIQACVEPAPNSNDHCDA